jgi:hypothetical protein
MNPKPLTVLPDPVSDTPSRPRCTDLLHHAPSSLSSLKKSMLPREGHRTVAGGAAQDALGVRSATPGTPCAESTRPCRGDGSPEVIVLPHCPRRLAVHHAKCWELGDKVHVLPIRSFAVNPTARIKLPDRD